jgi:hypothetical protein
MRTLSGKTLKVFGGRRFSGHRINAVLAKGVLLMPEFDRPALSNAHLDWASRFCGLPIGTVTADAPIDAGESDGAIEQINGKAAQPEGSGSDGEKRDSATTQKPDESGTTKPDGTSLVNNPDFERLVESMESDADDAAAQWKSQLSNGLMSRLSSSMVAEYRADGSDTEAARSAFIGEWNNVVKNQGDHDKLVNAFDAFWLKLAALQENNARYKALIDANILAMGAALIALLVAFAQSIVAKTKQLEIELRRLEENLKAAERAVTKAEIKRALNALASAVTLIFVPEAAMARLAVSLGAITFHVVVDNSLGSGTVKGTVVFVAGDGADIVEHLGEHGEHLVKELGEGGKKFLGAAAAVATLKFDTEEVGELQEIAAQIREEIERIRASYASLMAEAQRLAPNRTAMQTSLTALTQAINTALGQSTEAKKNYDDLREMIVEAGSGS